MTMMQTSMPGQSSQAGADAALVDRMLSDAGILAPGNQPLLGQPQVPMHQMIGNTGPMTGTWSTPPPAPAQAPAAPAPTVQPTQPPFQQPYPQQMVPSQPAPQPAPFTPQDEPVIVFGQEWRPQNQPSQAPTQVPGQQPGQATQPPQTGDPMVRPTAEQLRIRELEARIASQANEMAGYQTANLNARIQAAQEQMVQQVGPQLAMSLQQRYGLTPEVAQQIGRQVAQQQATIYANQARQAAVNQQAQQLRVRAAQEVAAEFQVPADQLLNLNSRQEMRTQAELMRMKANMANIAQAQVPVQQFANGVPSGQVTDMQYLQGFGSGDPQFQDFNRAAQIAARMGILP